MRKEGKNGKKIDFAQLYLWIGLILLMVMPWLLTRTWGMFSFNETTGVIGDTIGGITAPVSGFLGAYLVYRALQEQVKANKIITNQFQEQKVISYVFDQLNIVRDDIKEYKYSSYVGPEAIRKALKEFPNGHIEDSVKLAEHLIQIHEIKFFLDTIEYLLILTIKSDINKQDQSHLIKSIATTYKTKIEIALVDAEEKRQKTQQECTICNAKHGIPESLFSHFDSIKAIILYYK